MRQIRKAKFEPRISNYSMFCPLCRNKTNTINPTLKNTMTGKGMRSMMIGKCINCGCKKCSFTKKT